MMPKIDLHVHTNASDGKYSPGEIISMAVKHDVTVLAIADHDTVDGLSEAIKATQDLSDFRLIPAVELSSHSPGNEVHILGYFVRYMDSEFRSQLDILRNSRKERARGMILKLRDMGLEITLERVQEIAGEGSIGRPHIAQALLEKGYVASFQEVFTRYIGQGCPAYVERHKLSPEDIIVLILKAGGLPVLAHPTTVNDMENFIADMARAGLLGIEVYYKDYDSARRNELARLAKKYKLIATGGSDYHGLDESNEVMLGEAGVPAQAVNDLLALARERGCL